MQSDCVCTLPKHIDWQALSYFTQSEPNPDGSGKWITTVQALDFDAEGGEGAPAAEGAEGAPAAPAREEPTCAAGAHVDVPTAPGAELGDAAVVARAAEPAEDPGHAGEAEEVFRGAEDQAAGGQAIAEPLLLRPPVRSRA